MARTVLLIDDSPAIARQVEARLVGEDVTVVSATDGEAGLRMAREVRPDVVLLDVEMPGLDGFEVCRRLKLDPELMSTPVIFLAGSAATSDKILGLELGAIDFLPKPFDTADLRARVRSALTVKRLTDLLSARARVDSVTGLWNEVYFEARLSNEMALAQRSSRPVSIVVADIDQFKALNSEHGQWFGDHVLRAVGEVLGGAVRAEDVLCRSVGAEFAIICPSSTAEGAGILAERVRALISRMKLSAHGAELCVTASFGVAGVDQASAASMVDGAALTTAALRALALAKNRGRNQVVEATAELFPALSAGSGASSGAGADGGVGMRVERRGPIVMNPKAA